MKKFEGMLFCTDLDGTLYADDKTVSRENLVLLNISNRKAGFSPLSRDEFPQPQKKSAGLFALTVPMDVSTEAESTTTKTKNICGMYFCRRIF